MNLSELQAFLEDSGWDEEPFPAHPSDDDKPRKHSRRADDYEIESIELSSHKTSLSTEMPVLTDRVSAAKTPSTPAVVAETEKAQAKVAPEDLPETPTVAVEQDSPSLEAPVKLVPKLTNVVSSSETELRGSDTVSERLKEIEMAQKMGYLLCKCSWPPQIMVLTGTDHVYRCKRCSRVREM